MKSIEEFFIKLGMLVFFGITMVSAGSLVLLFSLIIAIKSKKIGSKITWGKWEFDL